MNEQENEWLGTMGSNSASAVPVSESISPIQELVGAIQANQEVLTKRIDNFIQKVGPVLKDVQSGGEAVDKREVSEVLAVYSPLSKDLLKIKQTQEQQIRKLEHLMEDLEI